MAERFRQITIIGTGLIGGSIGMAARRRALAKRVVGVGRKEDDADGPVRFGAVDVFTDDAAEAVKKADLVVLAVPVGQLEAVARSIAPSLQNGTTVTDVGSVKGGLVGRLEGSLGPQARFVGGHPIAGRERSGVAAADADLFEGAVCVLTPTPATDAKALDAVEALWTGLGARVVRLDPGEHDRIFAAVSHLPHLVAYALISALTEMDEQDPGLMSHSAGGLRDFTRIAASSPEMWRDICLANPDRIVEAVARFERSLSRLKSAVAAGDGEWLLAEFSAARTTRERLAEKTPSDSAANSPKRRVRGK